MTIREAFAQGHHRLRRPAWAQGEWLELVPVGGFLSPIGLIHSILENPDLPPDVQRAPQEVPLWLIHYDDFEEAP